LNPFVHPWPTFDSRPLLGANGTQAMKAVLANGGDELVDYLKVGPFMGQAAIAELAPAYPLMLHLDDTLSGHALPSAEMVCRLEGWIELTGTPCTLITQPASALLSRQKALDNITRNARALAERLKVPLILENVPFFPNLAHMFITEPDFVAEVVGRAGCDLLLDLAHARVSANVLGYSVEDYLARMPLERTVELHLSGPRPLKELDPKRQALVRENAQSAAHLISFGEKNLVDAHAPMQEEDYALLEWVLRRAEPKAISLEYFRQPEALREQLLRLNRVLGRNV